MKIHKIKNNNYAIIIFGSEFYKSVSNIAFVSLSITLFFRTHFNRKSKIYKELHN